MDPDWLTSALRSLARKVKLSEMGSSRSATHLSDAHASEGYSDEGGKRTPWAQLHRNCNEPLLSRYPDDARRRGPNDG
jgi:hypothetical protein